MNKITYFSFMIIILFLTGCTINNNANISNEDNAVKHIQEKVNKKENIQNKQQNNLDEIKTENITKDNIEDILGKNIVDENEENDKKNIDKKQNNVDCKDGYIYNTELKKCFKVGGSGNAVNVKIDPIVKSCIDKGGIYNAQVEKCFVH